MQHRSVLCRGVTAAVAVAAAAVILAAVPAGAAPGRVPHQPFVVTGKRNGPVDIHGSGVFGTIATLHVPNGAWVVLAKADVVNTTADLTGQRPVTCRLVAGGEVGHGQLMPVGASVDSSEQTMTLSIGRKLLSPGVGEFGKRTMLLLPSGKRPSETPRSCEAKLIPSIKTAEAEETPIDSPELLSLKLV